MPRRPEHQRVRFDPSAVEIVPLTLDRWDDVAALFGECGDPKTCWCMFWRVHSKEWSFANPTESREGLHALVHDARDPAPGLLAYEDGRPVGWVSVGPRADYRRLVHSRIRPAVDDRPVWSIVCFVVSRSARRRGLTSLLLDAAVVYARDHGAGARGLSRPPGGGPDPGRRRLHRPVVDVRGGRVRGRPRDRLARRHRPARDRPARRLRGAVAIRPARSAPPWGRGTTSFVVDPAPSFRPVDGPATTRVDCPPAWQIARRHLARGGTLRMMNHLLLRFATAPDGAVVDGRSVPISS